MTLTKSSHQSALYQAVVVALFLTLMGVVMGLASPGLSDTDLDVVASKGHLPVIAATCFFYCFILLRLLSIGGRIFALRSTLLTFAPLVLFCLASSAWSTTPSLSIRRSLFLLLSTIVGLILGIDFKVPELVRLWAAASLIHIILCAGFYVVAPALLYSPSDPHALKGLTTHKNIFGFEQGLAVITFLLVPFPRLARLRIPLALTASALLLLSHSGGALVATLCAAGALPFLFIFARRGAHRIPLALLSLTFIFGLVLLVSRNTSIVFTLLSKDPTLTGRTELWSLILIAIGHHPLFGYGYDSFWQGLQGDSLEIIRGVGWLVPTAHNGYLDLLLGVGIVGAALMLPLIIMAISRGFTYLSQERSTARYYPLAFLVFWLIYNLNESVLLTRSGLPFLFFTALVTSLGIPAHQRFRVSTPYRIPNPLDYPVTISAIPLPR